MLSGEWETDGLLGQEKPVTVSLCLHCLTYAFLEIWGVLSYSCDMFIRRQDSLNQVVCEQAFTISGFEKSGAISLVKQFLTPR